MAPSRPLLAIPFALLLTGKADPDAPGQAPWQVRRLAVARVPAPANFTSPRKIADTSRASHPWFGFGDFQPIPLKLAEHSVAPFALIGEGHSAAIAAQIHTAEQGGVQVAGNDSSR